MINEFIILTIAKIENEEDQIFMSDLCEKYHGLIYKRAFEYVENSYDAEEVAQKVYVNLIAQIPLLKTFDLHTLISYIVFTVKNTALNFIKERNRNSSAAFLFGDDDAMQEITDDNAMPEKIVLEKYEAEQVHEALSQLKQIYKYILESKYFKNMSSKEIAEHLNITQENVRKYLERARRALKKILEKEYDLSEIK